MTQEIKRIVLGISGASGAPLAKRTLEVLASIPNIEVHLVASKGAQLTCEYETDEPYCELEKLAFKTYDVTDLSAALSSGTFHTDGMIIVPCSMKTLAGIANGYSENLLLRAADVTIKEKRPLVLLPREAPLSPIHLKNMESLSMLANVYIVPPVFSYYIKPATLENMELHIIAKALRCLGIEVPNSEHWGEEQ